MPQKLQDVRCSLGFYLVHNLTRDSQLFVQNEQKYAITFI